MWLYTKRQYKSAIEDKDKEMEEILDTFRDEIIKDLKSLVKSEDYNEKYKLLLRHKGYYEAIKNDLNTQRKSLNDIFKKYDLHIRVYFVFSRCKGCCFLCETLFFEVFNF